MYEKFNGYGNVKYPPPPYSVYRSASDAIIPSHGKGVLAVFSATVSLIEYSCLFTNWIHLKIDV